MKIVCCILCIILSGSVLFAEDAASGDAVFEQPPHEEPEVTVMNGMHAGVSACDYFKITAGLQLGDYSVAWHHFSGMVYGISIDYQLLKNMTLRGFWRMYGGSAGVLFGVSIPVTTNFTSWTAGIAPEIGIGFGPMNLYNRFNFYLDRDFSNHEIGLVFYSPL